MNNLEDALLRLNSVKMNLYPRQTVTNRLGIIKADLHRCIEDLEDLPGLQDTVRNIHAALYPRQTVTNRLGILELRISDCMADIENIERRRHENI